MGSLSSKMLTVSQLSGKGKKSFEKYMGSTKAFAKAVEKDAGGALTMMLDRLGKLNKADRMAFLTQFSGMEWSDEMLRVVEARDNLQKFMDLADDPTKWAGGLDKSYQLKLDDFWSQLQLAKNDLDVLMIDLGTMAMPGMKAGVREARTIIQDIGTNIDLFPSLIDAGALSEAMASLGKLKTAIEDALNIDTSGSQIDAFFRDLADAVNAVSAKNNTVAEAIKTIKEYFPGQSEAERNSPTCPDDREFGFGPNGPKAFEGGVVDRYLDMVELSYDRLTGSTADLVQGQTVTHSGGSVAGLNIRAPINITGGTTYTFSPPAPLGADQAPTGAILYNNEFRSAAGQAPVNAAFSAATLVNSRSSKNQLIRSRTGPFARCFAIFDPNLACEEGYTGTQASETGKWRESPFLSFKWVWDGGHQNNSGQLLLGAELRRQAEIGGWFS